MAGQCLEDFPTKYCALDAVLTAADASDDSGNGEPQDRHLATVGNKSVSAV